ncbi:PREDICTED: protocadherin-23 [Dipodomys ordii]|uniref:Protocadherin-23 n=1 Tax=Dipodomys ordii TaxID=10020 RepID=A0A1S3GA93_DIPOR|nr:PREDICTED: protocadherin-23 [Dipodomys ordii]
MFLALFASSLSVNQDLNFSPGPASGEALPTYGLQRSGFCVCATTPSLSVKASDADAGLYGLVEYSLYNGFQSAEAPPAFQIDPHDGRICVSQDIDREQDPDTFDLLVKAKDGGGLSAQAFVRVELEDVNDNRPVFTPTTYVTSISGETQPGTEVISVLARDRDSGVYGTVAYELMPGDLSDLFTIDSTTGIIYLTSPINHLEPTTLFLMVCARDGGGLTAAVNAEVTIHVLQNTLAPAEFERPKYTFSVYEDVPAASPVGTVKARESSNSSEPIFYQISSGDLDGKFSIHPWLGTIHTQKRLDHESQPGVVLTVQAQLGSSPTYSSTQVNITVMDVNDNSPEFPMASDEIRIPQTTPPGTALYLARAEDKDSGPNGLIWYTIASPSPSIFAIDSRLGVVFLHGNLGSHAPQRHTLILVAEDHGAPAHSSQMVLTVAVEKQEQRPALTFENWVYQVEVRESLSVMAQMLQIQAWPLGLLRPHLQVVYSLEASVDSATFGIHPHTGWIYLRRQLDYESTRAYSLRAFAYIPEDRLVQNGSTSVTVHVLDENDNSPTFLHGPLFLKVLESPVPLGVIGQITAVDSDSGKNGQLSYFLLSDGKFFKMNPNTEILTTVLHLLAVFTIEVYSPFIHLKQIGELVSWSALDREHQGHHQLTVLVTDHGSPPRNATTVVYVTVIDTNDNRPFFPQCLPGKEFSIKVLEGQPVNTLVTTVFAKDLDEGRNAEVSYSLSPEDHSDHFKIDSNNGEIRTSTVLSRDYRPSYRITIIASDQGVPPLQGQAVVNIQRTPHYLLRVSARDPRARPPRHASVFLSIAVDDRNDHAPAFPDEFVVLGVEENVPEGTLVYNFTAKDGDGGFLNSRVHYSMEPHPAGPSPFLIHPARGSLLTAAPLDRERVPRVPLTVTASDQAANLTDRRLRSVVAHVVILDVNDHSPAFVSAPVAWVPEDAAVGSTVHHVRAHDPDQGRNGSVTYSILPGDHGGAFALDAASGLLTTACPLDYEIRTQYILTIMARDGGTPALSSSQIVTVTVLDVNDQAPLFMQPLYEASVKENQSPGAFVTRVEAEDRDLGGVNYQILTGVLKLPQHSVSPNKSSIVLPEEFRGRPDHWRILKLESSNLKSRDFARESYKGMLMEGINSQLQFEIMPGASSGLFKINPDSGEVVTATILDREIQQVFTLLVLVRDRGAPELSSTTTILCTVEDENDHAPEFIVPDHDIEVLENREPETVYTVWASDQDAGNNGTVRYHIIHGNTNDSFAIHEMSGELSTTHALDREQVSNFTLLILCSDLGHPPRSSVLQLQVRVLDDNDNSPSFPLLYYQSSVREDAQLGTVVLVLAAKDRDLGRNGQTEYFLMDESSSAFTIDSAAGILRTTLTLDRETTSQYTFRAVARDCSIQGSRSTTVTVNIAVTDANDNDPILEQNPFDIFLSPQLPTNQTIAFLRAHDPDMGPNGTVSFSFADAQSVVSIDAYTGEITLRQNPSPEYFPLWLQLRVTDHGAPARATTGLVVIHMEGEAVKVSFSQHVYKGFVMENCEAGTSVVTVEAFVSDSIQDSIEYSIFSGNEDGIFSLGSKSAESSGQIAYSKVVILIQDVNDHFPRFGQRVYQASVSEGQPYNTYVIQVFATDPDSGLNGLVDYSFLSGNEEETFHIDATSGVITTKADLDYESTSSYSLIVQATDRGVPQRSDTAVIKVQVTDRNDNPPTLPPWDTVEIAENSLPGVIVSRVSAHDADANPAFIFSITQASSPGTKFAIDQNTGEMMLVQPLDFEDTTEYELFIHVSDSVHHTQGSLVIRVLDVNDNPPVFSQEIYQVTVPESVPLGHSVLSVSAIDLESSENISYRILSSPQEFAIDPVNGTIFTINPVLLLETTSIIRFLVEANDGGIPPLKALTLVEVKIADLNDQAPEFPVELYNLSLSEDTPIGSTLITFSTTDRDWTLDNTHVEYAVISGQSQNIFHVETRFLPSEYPFKQVGSLVLLRNLDREASDSHQLVILASDHGCPPLSSTLVVSIQVLDVNDSPPEFTSLEYHAHVKESTPAGSHITMISAHDSDIGSHAEIVYDIISGNEKGHFHLEAKTGVFYLARPLDYEEIIKFTLTVRASDEERKQFAFAVVLIHVLDDNDHMPQFLSSSMNCVVPENRPVPFTICSVNAVDLDSGPYGEVTYSILSPCFVTHGIPPAHDLFVIDPFTGDIQAKQILDYESIDSYCLVVQAEDRGGLTSSLMLWVEVEGVDEYEPIFTQDQYFFSLPAEIGGRQLIGRVEAFDADAGADGVVLYSLETASPFFSVNKTNGNIYWVRAPPFLDSHRGKEGTLEMKIMAHSPKPGSKFTLCSVFVNGSLSSEGNLATVHKQKEDTPHSSKEKKTSSNLEPNLRMTGDASMFQAFQEVKGGGDEAGAGGTVPEWLGLISILQKDTVHLYRHSNSSGHCSVEGETAEDKEIQQINEHPYRKDSDSALSERGSRVPDSGIPRDSDQLSCLSGETDGMAVADAVESSHTFEGDEGGKGLVYVQNNELPQALQQRDTSQEVRADGRNEFISEAQEVKRATFLPQITCDHDVRGSSWNSLLRWEPRFQPLASVFNDLAKLKDENVPTPGILKNRKSSVCLPPLITAVAQPGIKAVPPRMPAIAPAQVLHEYPRSPILYHGSSPPEAMTPSFSPSLSLLTIQASATLPALLGTHRGGTGHELEAGDEVQI